MMSWLTNQRCWHGMESKNYNLAHNSRYLASGTRWHETGQGMTHLIEFVYGRTVCLWEKPKFQVYILQYYTKNWVCPKNTFYWIKVLHLMNSVSMHPEPLLWFE